jgi:branched-chain amino acid transport system substrate-binding protein
MRRLLAVAGTLLIVTACGGSGPGGGGASTINLNLGVPMDLTGPIAFIGVEQGNAAQLAADDVNKNNKKVHINVTIKDVRSSVADATSVIQSMVADPTITGFVGIAYTQEGQAVTPILKADGRPTMFLQVSAIPSRPANVFSFASPRHSPAQQLVDKGLKKAGVKTVSIIYQDQASLNTDVSNIKSMSAAAGMTVVDVQGSTLQETAFDTQVTKVVATNPDAVGVIALAPQTATVATKLRARGYKGIIFGQPGALTAAFFQAAGQAAEGVQIFTFWDKGIANAEATRFMKLYKAAYPNASEPDYYALQAWDAIHIMATAAEKVGGTDKAKLVQTLQTETFSGALQEKMQFNSDGFMVINGLAVKCHAGGLTEVLK